MARKKRTLLIDGDVIAFECCISNEMEIEWEEDLWVLYSDASECKQRFDARIRHFMEDLAADDVVIAFSDKENFRKDVYPDYKSNRKGKRKPLAYKALVDYAASAYKTRVIPTLEADDVLGILSTGRQIKGEKVVVSIDKDLMTVPGLLFNPSTPELGVQKISKDYANYQHLWQTLVGDRVDGYPGCPMYGKKKAHVLLDQTPTWEAVVQAFDSQGLSEEVALQQARLARICRNTDYDSRNKKVILWNPTK